jgi:hypothetical protein
LVIFVDDCFMSACLLQEPSATYKVKLRLLDICLPLLSDFLYACILTITKIDCVRCTETMEKIHRQAILKNIHQLIYTKNFDKLCDRFVVEGVYSDALIEEVVVSCLNIRRWSN